MIRGTKRALEKRPSVKANINAAIHNRFDIEVVDAKTGEVKQKAQAFNVICNKLWDYALSSNGSSTQYFKYIQYGSGTGTPAATDTALFKRVGGVSATGTTVSVNKEDFTVSVQKRISILETEAVGVEITEVGISMDSSNNLCTHAMLQDMNGNPISILKTDTDIINVYATIFVRFPEKHRTFTEDNDIMLSDIAAWARHLCGTDNNDNYPGIPARAQLQVAPVASSTTGLYTAHGASGTINADTKTVTYKYGRFAAADNNLPGGARYVVLMSSNVSVYAGSPIAVVKTSGTKVLDEAVGTGDGVTVDFATKFDCPKNAVIKVDGAVVDAVVEPAPLLYQNMDYYFQEIEVVDGNPVVRFRNSTNDMLYGATVTDETLTIYEWSTFYNPHHKYGIASFKAGAGSSDTFQVLVSDDLQTWHSLTFSSSRNEVPAEYQYYKYWKMMSFNSSYYIKELYAKDLNGTNIHFATPPADGAVITIDYDTEVLGKDENHVYDFEMTVTFGEYNPDA